MIVKISGTEYPYRFGTIDINDDIGRRSTASFVIVDRDKNMRFTKGKPVVILEADGITKMFAGCIESSSQGYTDVSGRSVLHRIQCTDWTYITDRRLVARAYESTLAGNIVKDLITTYLADEGITVGTIQDGPMVTEAVFNYIYATKSLEELAEKAQFEWWINSDKELNFVSRDTFLSGSTINDTSPIKNISVEEVSEKYRNRQYIKAGKDITDPQTERFVADGEAKSWTVGYGIAKLPVININGVAKDVGVKGLHNEQDFYFSRGNNTITQDKDGIIIPKDSIIEVVYQGLFDIVAITYDQGEVNDRKTIEGGTGFYEELDESPQTTSRDAAFEEANAKLQRFGKLGKRIIFNTEKLTDLKAGTLLPISLLDFDCNDNFLIESVKIKQLGTPDGRPIRTVTAILGSSTGGWVEFFKRMATTNRTFVIRENISESEILTLLETSFGAHSMTDGTTDYTVWQCPLASTSLYPSNIVYPC